MSEIKIPADADEAIAMALVGMAWLKQKAPEKLTELHTEIQAEAGRKGYVAGARKWVAAVHPDYADDAVADIEADADEYAFKVRQGGE